jgi:hypothetical protein
VAEEGTPPQRDRQRAPHRRGEIAEVGTGNGESPFTDLDNEASPH